MNTPIFSVRRQAMRNGKALAATSQWKRDQASRIGIMRHGYAGLLLAAFVRGWRRVQK